MLKKYKKTIFIGAVLALLLVGAVFGAIKFLPFVGDAFVNQNIQGQAYVFAKATADQLMAGLFGLISETASSTANFVESNHYLADFGSIKNSFLKEKTDFIEVNLPEMKVRVFQKGQIKKEVNILVRGDPESWGGTAAGLYKVISGNKESYSVTSELYMPWALKFYGKYYIHGQPYDNYGQEYTSDLSGGCLRLLNQDAEDIYHLSELAEPVLVIDHLNDDYQYAISSIKPFPQITAQSYLIADLANGFVLSNKNPLEKRPLASITKLMTATVVAEQIGLKKTIMVSKEALDRGYSQTQGLEDGKSFGVVELFYPLLIQSSNDTAEVLASFLGRNRTIQLMNEKAKSIGMQNTTFACPSGYDPANISTAKDLYYLARYVFYNRPTFFKISKGEKVPFFQPITFLLEELWNKNIFINDSTFVGGKTGYITSSGYNGLFVFKLVDSNGQTRPIAIILLGSTGLNTRKSDTQKIYIWLKNNYFPQTKAEEIQIND